MSVVCENGELVISMKALKLRTEVGLRDANVDGKLGMIGCVDCSAIDRRQLKESKRALI